MATKEPARRVVKPVTREPGDRQFASTLERGLRVLQCFSVDSPELGNTEITVRTGLPKATVSRLTHTLVKLGYLERSQGNSGFGLGMGVLSLGYPLLASLQLRRLAAGPMRDLADLIDGAVAIDVRAHLSVVAIESAIVRDVLGGNPTVGRELPLLSTATGMAWIIGASPDERQRAVRELEHAEPGSWARNKARYDALKKQFTQLGYIKVSNTRRINTTAMSVPLRRRPGAGLMVLSCVLDINEQEQEMLEQRAGNALLATAHIINAKLLKT
jgi:DNA-binding IclR family transcriptional regulator